MPHDEDIIIQKLRDGDREIFQYIYNTYSTHLLNFAFRFVADENVCKDLIQETFIALWENKNTTTIKSLKRYLYTSIKNKCLLHLRHLGIRDKNKMGIIESYLFDQTDTDVFNDDVKKEILHAVNILPKEMKRIFRAKYIHELTVNEIAEDFDLSPNTVATQLKRARKKIREELLKEKK